MKDIPDFAEALLRFRRFLAENGHPTEVFWVFSEDLYPLSLTQALVKYPPAPENGQLAQKVFAEGCERGLVEIKAVAVADNKVAATIWFPKHPNEEVQGWNRGMKLAILQPLPSARLVGEWQWRLFRFLPRYRRSWAVESFIGTRAWAGRITTERSRPQRSCVFLPEIRAAADSER